MDQLNKLSIAVLYIADIRAHDNALMRASQQAGRFSTYLASLEDKKKLAEEQLRRSDEMRRALLYLPSSSKHTPSLETIVEVWTRHFPGHSCERNDRTMFLGDFMLKTFSSPNEDGLSETQKSIVEFARTSLPITFRRRFLQTDTFWRAALTPDGFTGVSPLSLEMVYRRLRKFEDYLQGNPKGSETDGSIWLDTSPAERQKELLGISSAFPTYLGHRLATDFHSAYLDDIALDAGGNTPARIRTKCSKKNKHIYHSSPPKITGIDLVATDNSLLGTVMQIDNALSPAFVKKYLQAMENASFTQDGRRSKHDRGYRFSSLGHKEDGTCPCWIMFGETEISPSLLLSQYTNPAEISMMRVVNLIYHLYRDFVNEKFERSFGTAAVGKWGLPAMEEGHYDSIMTMAANPVNSKYGLHDDGKPGLCVPDQKIEGDVSGYTPNPYSKFNLIVPTVCIQNHTKKTTSIEFFDKKFPTGKPVGAVHCGVVTIHVQLLGVQQTCKHIVSDSPPIGNPFPKGYLSDSSPFPPSCLFPMLQGKKP
jgi:hypothetical protein